MTEPAGLLQAGERHYRDPGAIGSCSCHTPMLVLRAWGLQSKGDCRGSLKEPVPLGEAVSLEAGDEHERPAGP